MSPNKWCRILVRFLTQFLSQGGALTGRGEYVRNWPHKGVSWLISHACAVVVRNGCATISRWLPTWDNQHAWVSSTHLSRRLRFVANAMVLRGKNAWRQSSLCACSAHPCLLSSPVSLVAVEERICFFFWRGEFGAGSGTTESCSEKSPRSEHSLLAPGELRRNA
jgi:hypothetical protein